MKKKRKVTWNDVCVTSSQNKEHKNKLIKLVDHFPHHNANFGQWF